MEKEHEGNEPITDFFDTETELIDFGLNKFFPELIDELVEPTRKLIATNPHTFGLALKPTLTTDALDGGIELLVDLDRRQQGREG